MPSPDTRWIIGTLLLVAGLLGFQLASLHSRIDDAHTRIEDTNKQVDKIDAKLDGITGKLDDLHADVRLLSARPDKHAAER